MSCSPFDLRDFVLNELADSQRRLVETHLDSCDACREEAGRLHATQAALLSLPDEEIPQRIGFVSDRVFEPSGLRRWWGAFWGSAARLGFASAAMLSAALIVFALSRPAPAPPAAPQPDLAALEARFDERAQKAVTQAVAQAVAETTARQEVRTKTLLAASEDRHKLEMKAIQLAVEQDLDILRRRYNQLRVFMARADMEPPR